MDRTYICIDLKSFYASVECVERKLDPLTTNLVVADQSRTDKTICLAVSPSLKSLGIPGRERLFIVNQKVKEANIERMKKTPKGRFIGKSSNYEELKNNIELEIGFEIATPQMAKYIEISSKIYNVYLKYVAKEDIHVYSIDEVFMDVTKYLKGRNMDAYTFAETMILDVLSTTGITATAGIGTNMYLAKVAMDIVAKKKKPDENGVRIASLDEMQYRFELWDHTPLTDFWRVGRGIEERLEKLGLHTMGDIALCSEGNANDYYNEDLLYKEFGVNAELLIDHAWGYEPTTIKDIKSYKPNGKSISSGQVLHCGYDYIKARLIAKEMIDNLSLDLVSKNLVTNQIGLYIGYDISNISEKYGGEVKKDYYGRTAPKSSHGAINLGDYTSSSKKMICALAELFDNIVNRKLLIRRINVSANNVLYENEADKIKKVEQLSLFDSYERKTESERKNKEVEQREKKAQKTILEIKKKYGKNAILKGMNYEEGSTAKERNEQIGGHKA